MSLPTKISKFLAEHPTGVCALDLDNTVWDYDYNVSKNAREVVKACKKKDHRIAVVTYNSEMTHGKCCTDEALVDLGLCNKNKCVVPKSRWANRLNHNDMVVNGRELKINGGIRENRDMKSIIMKEKMRLDPSNTLFIDDDYTNITEAKKAGFHTHRVIDGPL